MSVENLLSSIARKYLHFNRVDSYRDFDGADILDGKQLPKDQEGNTNSKFVKAPTFSVADYYDTCRARTYACCVSLENSDFIWQRYGGQTQHGKVCLELNFGKLRERLNKLFDSGTAELFYNGLRCHQIFSINYGLVEYVDWSNYQANAEILPNPIVYTHLKDKQYEPERELRISMSAFGMGQFGLNDGTIMEFPASLQVKFDFHEAIASGTIQRVLILPNSDKRFLTEEFASLGIHPRPEPPEAGP